jgi:predicted metal-binding membrane protein
MAVLAVFGLMNLALMAVFAVVFFLEKTWRYGIMLSQLAGAACVILGLAVIIRPDVLHLV